MATRFGNYKIIPSADQIKSMQHAEYWNIDNDYSQYIPNHTESLDDEKVLL
ncbi:MAG: hypothetical protein HUJ52_03915 [Malacoplasma sp.]|nr:hypothetical protein [Malacoplasma sp.]